MYTSVHEDSELIFDEPIDQKTMVSQEVSCLNRLFTTLHPCFALCMRLKSFLPGSNLFYQVAGEDIEKDLELLYSRV